ncbi:GGDEF domain-containing protein [Mesorhizobium sp. YR577]|uniref:GGDEF domain-containing protein n=1 Tax=Mesorhizobium sp. YR577 TaxID=1884373 RepID=UPI0008EA23A4|nr:GGDEF domain-containing protein [Mesorhizobium sp. YR577]SFT79067.1 diguanylate cyclase (GGDEF) domain-containing protein [Mesorhizobium sp. YR577]
MAFQIDLNTLMLCSMLVTATCGVLFLLEAWRRREIASSLWWGIGFACSTVSLLFYIASSAPQLDWLGPVGNGFVVATMSFIWVGARSFNGRSAAIVPALVGPFLVIIVPLLMSRPLVAWSGAVPFFFVFSLFSLMAGFEFWRGGANRYQNAMILAVTSSFNGLYYAGRGTVLWLTSPDHPFFIAYFGSKVATIEVMLLILISSFTLVALGREQTEMALRRAATHDVLTDVLNRREFISRAEQLLQRLALTRAPVTVLVMDLDFFKKINDTYGHPVGDQVLVMFAAMAKSTIRGSDLLCRHGGEEFVICLPGVGQRRAIDIAESIRARCAEIAIVTERGTLRPTISIGVASAPFSQRDLPSLIAEADEALYLAKSEGRNRVATAA